MIRNLFIVLVLSSGVLHGQVRGRSPAPFPKLFSLSRTTVADSTQAGLQSNVIVEIRTQGDTLVWLGTGQGLSVLRDSLTARTFLSSQELKGGENVTKLPEGGVSAIGVANDDTLIVAVATTTEDPTSGEDVQTGAGLALSVNSQDTTAVNWRYFSQPVDSSGDSTLIWGGVSLEALPVTVPQQNVTYDIAIGNEYFWIASWAGGLRRLDRSDVSSGWERVPLPQDAQTDLACGEQVSDYELNPRDPPDGNHNHKGFSVLVYGDTVWVGTAGGINRGILDESGCVDWIHYSYPLSGITGNWVVALARQQWKGVRKIWAVTLRADEPGEDHGVSYTPDDGLTWYPVSALRDRRGYNIYTVDSLVYVATEDGLWKSEDGVTFALFRPAVDAVNNDEILDNDVYAVVHDVRDFWQGPDSLGALFIGTGDGLARSPDPGTDEPVWEIYRTHVSSNQPYAYPNPFSPSVYNIVDGDGHVRFFYRGKRPRMELRIYNFAMEKVRSIDYETGGGQGTLKWDGRDEQGGLVANGTYFCNLFYDDQSHWIKLIVLK
ncbi:MAG: FlgD immunoglobulin-like domain containing protein [Candidatus Neomarinimicrobiota bacterium]